MIPIRALYSAMADGFIGYVSFLTATLGKVVPLKQPYTPGPDLTFAGITVANFTGSTALTQDDEPTYYIDPGTGDLIVNLVEPAGGWQWVTSDTVNLPQVIHGYALLNAAGNAVVAVTEPLADPITLDGALQGIDAGPLTFRIPLGSVS